MGCIDLCGGFHTPQRQALRQIPIGFCAYFIGICVCLDVGQCVYVRQRERTILRLKS